MLITTEYLVKKNDLYDHASERQHFALCSRRRCLLHFVVIGVDVVHDGAEFNFIFALWRHVVQY